MMGLADAQTGAGAGVARQEGAQLQKLPLPARQVRGGGRAAPALTVR